MLILGKCLQHVSVDKVFKLLERAYRKINIEIDDNVFEEIIKKDEHFLKCIRKPYSLQDSERSEHHLV